MSRSRPRITIFSKTLSGALSRCWQRIAALAILVVLAPASLLAQPVTVTAGEHRDFTRIVIQSAQSFAWMLDEDETAVTIRIPGRSVRLDRSRTMDRIPRTRVATLEAESDTLIVGLACLCSVRAFEDRAGVLVLDLRDAADAADAGVTRPDPQERRVSAPVRPDAGAAGRAVARAHRLAEPGPAASEALRTGSYPFRRDATLMMDLAGMIAGEIERGDAAVAGQASPLPEVNRTSAPLPENMRLHVPGTTEQATPDSHPDNTGCVPDTALAFATSTDTTSFVANLAALHERLVVDLDHVDQGATQALAEFYIAQGLGAEARHVLDLVNPQSPHHDILAGIADSLEDRHSNQRLGLWSQRHCGGLAMLFGLIAGPVRDDDLAGHLDSNAVAAHFQNLTPALRGQFGPKVISILIPRGEIDAARMVLDALIGAESRDTDTIRRWTAELERARGNHTYADGTLSELEPTDIETFLLRLQSGASSGHTVPADVMQSAAGLAEIHRTESSGQRLLELIVQDLIRSGDLAEAFRELERYARWTRHIPSGGPVSDRLLAEAWFAALELPDAMFVDLVLTRDDWRRATLDTDLAQAFRNRFDALGLSRLANAMLTNPASDHRSSTERSIRETSRQFGPDDGYPEGTRSSELTAQFAGRERWISESPVPLRRDTSGLTAGSATPRERSEPSRPSMAAPVRIDERIEGDATTLVTPGLRTQPANEASLTLTPEVPSEGTRVSAAEAEGRDANADLEGRSSAETAQTRPSTTPTLAAPPLVSGVSPPGSGGINPTLEETDRSGNAPENAPGGAPEERDALTLSLEALAASRRLRDTLDGLNLPDR